MEIGTHEHPIGYFVASEAVAAEHGIPLRQCLVSLSMTRAPILRCRSIRRMSKLSNSFVPVVKSDVEQL
jgi:hypothetical protein